MKILHVIPSVASIRGGPSQAILQMAYALNKQGTTTEIATTNDNGTTLLDVPLHHCIDYNGCPIRFFPRFSPSISVVREFAYSSGFTSWLWASIHTYDLIHIHAIFSYVPTVTMAIARLKNIPYIARPLGQLCQWSLQRSQRKKQIYLKLIEYDNLNHAQSLHFTSDAERQEALELGLNTPSIVIPHGLSIPTHHPNAKTQLRTWLQLPNDEPVILFLSRLHPKKGLDILISSLSRIRHRRFTFVIAGSGEPNYETEIRDRLQQTGMGDRTRMVGFIEGKQKDLLLQGSDLFALTSYSENFGVAVLEALAAGLPTIVTPGVALSEVVKHHDLGIVPELEEEAISTAILTCLSQPDIMREMGDRARQFILQNYTWDKIATQLIDVYEGILGVGLPGRSPYRPTCSSRTKD